MKRIPKGFQLGPHWWTVQIVTEGQMREACKEFDSPLHAAELSPWGLTVYETHTIFVQKSRKVFPKEAQLHCFWHEYFHALLYSVGRERLSRDENLVDVLGGLQLQAFQSAEF